MFFVVLVVAGFGSARAATNDNAVNYIQSSDIIDMSLSHYAVKSIEASLKLLQDRAAITDGKLVQCVKSKDYAELQNSVVQKNFITPEFNQHFFDFVKANFSDDELKSLTAYYSTNEAKETLSELKKIENDPFNYKPDMEKLKTNNQFKVKILGEELTKKEGSILASNIQPIITNRAKELHDINYEAPLDDYLQKCIHNQ